MPHATPTPPLGFKVNILDVGFAARRYLARLAQSIESRYVDSIRAARNGIAIELAKAYGS